MQHLRYKILSCGVFVVVGCTSTTDTESTVSTSSSQTTTTSHSSSTTTQSTTTTETSTATTETSVTTQTKTCENATVVAAAQAFLDSLDAKQLSQVSFDVDDLSTRQEWSNLPALIYPRTGLALGDLDQKQRDYLYDLLAASQSEQGFEKSDDIVTVEEYLLLYNGDAMAGWDHFYTAFFGVPSDETPWSWQFDGHHLALNFTMGCDSYTMSPSLWGISPNTIPKWGTDLDGTIILDNEVGLAYSLMESLSPAQLAMAQVDTEFNGNLVAGPGQNSGNFPPPSGLSTKTMDAKQQALLYDLVSVYLGNLPDAHATLQLFEMEENFSDLWFLWKGPLTTTENSYYQIQGPTLFIELDEGLGVEHFHAVYRDPRDDYGLDILAQHKTNFH